MFVDRVCARRCHLGRKTLKRTVPHGSLQRSRASSRTRYSGNWCGFSWRLAVDGFAGAVGATAGIFLPSIALTVLATPLLLQYGAHPRVAGFVRGVTVAVVGVLAGTTYLIGRPVIVDAFAAVLFVRVAVDSKMYRVRFIPC